MNFGTAQGGGAQSAEHNFLLQNSNLKAMLFFFIARTAIMELKVNL